VNSAFSLQMSRCETSAQLLHSRSAADLSPAYATPHSLVPCTHRPVGHRRRCTKRLIIVENGRRKSSVDSNPTVSPSRPRCSVIMTDAAVMCAAMAHALLSDSAAKHSKTPCVPTFAPPPVEKVNVARTRLPSVGFRS